MKSRLVAVFLLAFALAGCGDVAPTDSAKPPVILWAWERAEDLRFAPTDKYGVAFLFQTLNLTGENVQIVPRRQPLKVAPNAYLIAVTRIETDKRNGVALNEKQTAEILTLLKKSAAAPNVKEIQIDFDATVSERDFYRNLLKIARAELPANVPLSMTALASWCAGDDWLENLPVAEAVPMIFDMGADDRKIKDFLATDADWNAPLCRASYGVSLNEPLKINFRPKRKLFVFKESSEGWKEADLSRVPPGVK